MPLSAIPSVPDATENSRRILVIDDDVELCELLEEYLRPEGFLVDVVHSGTAGTDAALAQKYDLLILDVMLPGTRGFDVLQKIRAKSRVPVIMLSARAEEVDRILGLEMGADDYLPKPFNPRELAARIQAVLRRMAQPTYEAKAATEIVRLADIEYDRNSRRILLKGREVELTAVEFDLLGIFLRTPGTVIDRDQLSREVLGRKPAAFDRSLDVHVSHLRRKLGPLPGGGERIKSIRSVGYLYAARNVRAELSHE